jgi:hypothetical protein
VEKWSQEYPDWAMNSMWWDNIEHWNGNVAGLRRFVNARIDCLSQDICSQFGLSGMASLKLQIAPEGSGNIQISSLFIDDSEWIGRYFKGVPIAVRAIPYDNFRFSHWEALKSTSANPISVTLNSGGTLRAVFESNLANKPGVVINEINYHSNPEHDTQDWVELYNNGADVNLAWWLFKDTNDIFYLNANLILKRGDYLVVCEDTAAFKSFYPDVDNVIGNFQFRLNNDGEVIQLCSNLGTVIDSLIYSNRYPWSIMPDGGGATLELKNPNMDNTLAYAWSASDGYGSPGRVNGNFTTGVLDSGEKIAASFQLYPNFPNPFNATTTIQYEISEPSLVTVSIYNLRGQLVKIIQSEWLQPGYQQLNWDAGQLSSGLYFFRVSAGEQIATRKCLLIK